MQRIVDAALGLVREGGLYELTMANLARAIHVREAALAARVGGIDQVRDRVTLWALRDLTGHLSLSISRLAGRDALDSYIGAQRLYAQAQPRLHEAALRPLTVLSPEALEALEAYAALELSILKTFGVPSHHAAALGWCLRAMVRGATGLEAADPLTHAHEIDRNYEQLTSLCEAAARSGAALAGGRPVAQEQDG